MASNAARGARAKSRTRRWLEGLGYQVVDLEKVYWIFKPDGTRIPTKKDQMASDLLAIASSSFVGLIGLADGITDRNHAVVFVQVKSGASAVGGTFPAARRAFAAYSFPACTSQVVIAWPPRARVPRIVVM